MSKVYDFTSPSPEAALLKPKPRFSWNPFHHLWTGMQHFAYFWAPISGCIYCWLWRMFFIGMASGAAIDHWWPK